MARVCLWCDGPIPARARRDALTCSQRCRQARHRVTAAVRDSSARSPHDASRGSTRQVLGDGLPRGTGDAYPSRDTRGRHDGSAAALRDVSPVDQPLQARRLAYADPPYPGKAFYYRDHPDYAGEVDHAALLSRLAMYDGWALSTSARALPDVLALAVAQGLTVRVAAWIRGARPHATAIHALNAWEPVLYAPVARRSRHDTSHGTGAPRRVDVLQHGVAPMLTLPSRVIGAKPAAFCRWIFDLVGATPDDELDDLYPGSGIVGRAWAAYTQTAPAS